MEVISQVERLYIVQKICVYVAAELNTIYHAIRENFRQVRGGLDLATVLSA